MNRRNFFGMLAGSAAAVPLAEIRAIAPEGADIRGLAPDSVIEIRRESNYIMVMRVPSPLRPETHARLREHMENFLAHSNLRNVTALVMEDCCDMELYRLDPPS